MADDIFDKKKIIAALRAQGVPDKDIEKLYGKLPPQPQAKPTSDNAWKYKNKHKRPVRQEDKDPDYEPIQEMQEKKVKKPRISKKKPKIKVKKPKNDWNTASENRLKALYEAGYSIEEIANEFKTTKDAITGKISRLRAAGWKGTIGTTHNPIPSPSSVQAANRKLSPGMKKFLAGALETNFGVVGRYFSKKWGLIEEKKFMGKGGGSAELTAAVIKSNQEVISALTKLDLSLKRGTSTLTKSVGNATSKMVDAINTAVELVKKNTATSGPMGNGGGGPAGGGAGGMGGAGVIAALLGGAGLAMLLGSRAEASINPTEQLDTDETDTEADLRKQGAPSDSEQTPEIDIKAKELSFEADDITFEADEFKFDTKRKGGTAGSLNPPDIGTAPGATPPGDNTTQPGADNTTPQAAPPTPTKKPSAGFFNDLADKLIGGRGGGGYAGGGGMDGKGGGPSVPKSPIPSDQQLDEKDSSWWKGKTTPGAGPTGTKPAADNTPGSGNAIQRAMAAAKAQLREEGVPEANLNAAAAHLVGQGLAESGLNPNLHHDNNTGYGIYGARNERATNMLNWMKQNGYSPDSLEGQMKAMAHEAMSSSYKPTRDALMGANDQNFNSVAKTITHDFERPAVENSQARSNYARQAYSTPEAVPNVTPDTNPIHIRPETGTMGIKPDAEPAIDPFGRSDTGKYNSDFSLRQGNRDPNQFNDNWRDSIQPQDLNPNSGAQLNAAQKDQDDRANSPSFDERFNAAFPDKRSDNRDGEDNAFQTTLLETTGPSHFSDYEGLRGTGGDSWQTMDS